MLLLTIPRDHLATARVSVARHLPMSVLLSKGVVLSTVSVDAILDARSRSTLSGLDCFDERRSPVGNPSSRARVPPPECPEVSIVLAQSPFSWLACG